MSFEYSCSAFGFAYQLLKTKCLKLSKSWYVFKFMLTYTYFYKQLQICEHTLSKTIMLKFSKFLVQP